MARTGFVFHPTYTDHRTGPGHPERPERLTSIVERLANSGLGGELERFEPSPIDPGWLAAVHEESYIQRVRQACEDGEVILDSADTAISRASYQVALLAAGGGSRQPIWLEILSAELGAPLTAVEADPLRGAARMAVEVLKG